MIIFSLSARHLSEQQRDFRGVGKGERFLARTRELLMNEMMATKPRIPTIQGLLILGGRQCAMGNSSEGWLYTGMVSRQHVCLLYIAVLCSCVPRRLSECWPTPAFICTWTVPSWLTLSACPRARPNFAGGCTIRHTSGIRR